MPANIACVAGTCRATISGTVAPVPISSNLSCNTNFSNTGRKIAIDGANDIYALMICGGNARVSVSTNGGSSYTAPADLALANVVEMAVMGGPARTAYIAAIQNTGAVMFTRTTDGGATWAPFTSIDTGANTGFGVSLDVFGDNVYVGARVNGDIHVLRNGARGTGAFLVTPVTQSAVFGEVVVDERNGDIWTVSDTPDYHLRRSTDGGVTFAPVINVVASPTVQAFYSDWTIARGNIYVAGSSPDTMNVLPTATPATAGVVSGLTNTVTSQDRAISADRATGNVYIAGQASGNAISLQRVLEGVTTVGSTRTIVASGASFPGVVAGPNNSAIVVYTVGTQVFATVQTY